MSFSKKRKAVVFTSILLILYGNGTYLRNYVFRTPISLWQDVVKKSPGLARAHANLGRVYMENGQYLEAKKELETAIRIDPESMEPVINLAKLNMNHFRRNDVALALFKKALRLAPKSAYTCKGLGDIYNKLGDYKKAEHFYTVAVKRMPFLTSAINNLAITKIFLNKKEEAVVVFKYGIKMDSTHADLNTNLAKLYADKKMFTQAVKTLETFLAKNRDFKPGYELLKKIKQREMSAQQSNSDA
jgi:tetratricopeptide (TPR) repeat protein